MIRIMHQARRLGLLAFLVALPAFLTACSDDLFTVTNPGRTLDEDLDDPGLVPAIVVGMSSDFSIVHDNNSVSVANLSDEAAATGNYEETRLQERGIARRQDFNSAYAQVHRARWVAENGIERMKEIPGYQFDGNPLTARAYLFAGMSNRVLGELFCQVTYDGGEALPKSAAFERALPYYQEALTHAQAAGNQEYINAARAGLAQTYFDLGQGSTAVQHAALVPTSFVHVAHYSSNSSRETNQFWSYSFQRNEISAYNTYAVEANDPRAPYRDCRQGGCLNAISADGTAPQFRQQKYADAGADIAVASGAEMRLIEAEVAYQAGQLGQAVAKVNEERAFYGLDPVSATTAVEVFQLIKNERFLVLWLTGRRLFDLDRWNDPFLSGGTIVHQGEANRARCLPLSENECETNQNAGCAGTYQ